MMISKPAQFSKSLINQFLYRLTVPPNSNRIRLTERFASPYGALCFHVFMGKRFPTGTLPPIIASSLVAGFKSN